MSPLPDEVQPTEDPALMVLAKAEYAIHYPTWLGFPAWSTLPDDAPGKVGAISRARLVLRVVREAGYLLEPMK